MSYLNHSYSPTHSLIRGLALLSLTKQTYCSGPVQLLYSSYTQHYYAVQDHVVVKMDIEGSEHSLLRQMHRHGTLPVIDTLLLECHGARKGDNCTDLLETVSRAAPNTRILREGIDYDGWDKASKIDVAEERRLVEACASLKDPAHFSLSLRSGPYNDTSRRTKI